MGAPRSRAPRISRRVVIEIGANSQGDRGDGKLYYVDSDGVVFKEVGAGESVQFPLLTGGYRMSLEVVIRPSVGKSRTPSGSAI